MLLGSGEDTWIRPPSANGFAGISTLEGLSATLWTQDTSGQRGTSSSSLGCCSSFTGGFPCWLALAVLRRTPAGMGRSFPPPQQRDEVQHPHGVPHCSARVRQGSALAASAPCAGEQRKELGAHGYHQPAPIERMAESPASLGLWRLEMSLFSLYHNTMF